MHNANIPDPSELPSSKQLLKSTIIALIAAGAILLAIVLPAEYGIDPTGIGQLTGLKRMGEIKTTLAQEALEAANEETSAVQPPSAAEPIENTRDETLSVTLAPSQSTEVKITMPEGTEVEFDWVATPGEVFYDLHGDSSSVNYHVYEKGTSAKEQGTLTAEFTGSHGWYWKNRSDALVTITINARGKYEQIKEMN